MNVEKIERGVCIYRTAFPLYSETFISQQARALRRYRPTVVARHKVSESEGIESYGIFEGDSKVSEALFTLFGVVGDNFDNILEGKNIRLLHAHFAPDAVLAMSIAERMDLPLIATCHGSDVTISDTDIFASRKISGWRYLLQRKSLFTNCSKFIAVSDFLRRKMIERGFPSSKVVRHYIGIDTDKFTPPLRRSSGEFERPYILSVARHSDVKGLDTLIEAFGKVSDRHPTVRLIQIGDGSLTTKLKQHAELIGINNRIEFVGPKSSSEVLKYMQNSRLLVLSSRKSKTGAEESFGLVLLEAASCGIPVVGTRVGGVPEAIADNENGFVVPADDPTSLAQAIDLVLSNSDLAVSMGRRGIEFARDNFSLSAQTRKLEEIYDEVI